MSTTISWTDETWNPVVGCNQVSPGCAHCYAKTLHDKRHKAKLAGADLPDQYLLPFEHVQLMPERLERPLHWKNPRRIFVNSVSDLFHEDVPFEFIDKVFAIMALTPQHTYQVLTKRPERMLGYCRDSRPKPLGNVWLGTSVENQHWADIRVPLLLKTPAAVRFLSCEPLLGPLDLRAFVHRSKGMRVCPRCLYRTNLNVLMCPNDGTWLGPDLAIDWVIVGGESGKGYRPMDLDWVRKIRDGCASASVAFFFKQGNGYRSEMSPTLDGVQWHQFPRELVPAAG